ncbi:cytochrome P450 [Solwaraspora sp. WMMB335]|uniref:cytochrome P450 n=1 Tax=Solwaraspora sp. WMMB335 TaxID=3404118 RepID=UPI003B957C4F
MTDTETSYAPGMNALFVHRYDLVRELLGSDALQNARLADPLLDALAPEKYRLHQPIKHFFGLWPVFSHGAYHQRVRAALRPVLDREATLAAVAGMRPDCRDMLVGLAVATPAGNGVDWVADFAHPYAVALLGRLFGVAPATMRELLGPTSRVMTYLSKPLSLHDDELAHEVRQALAVMVALVGDEILESPRSALARALAVLAADGELGHQVATAVTTQIITGTLDPLVALLTDTLLLFPATAPTGGARPADPAGHPAGHPGTSAGAVAEDLRLSCPIRFAPRHVNRPVEIAGNRLGPGDRVILGLATANLDPHRYDDPLACRIDRPGPPHLAFGQGAHYCLGAPLARWATGQLIEVLASGAVEIDVDRASLVRDRHLSISKVLALRVRVTRGAGDIVGKVSSA